MQMTLQLSYSPHLLEFKYPFKISFSARTHTPIVITQIKLGDSIGYGEAAMPPYLGESHETVISFLDKAKPILHQFKYPFDIATINRLIDAIEINNMAAKASIDIALHDLLGKIEGKPCYSYYNKVEKKRFSTSITLGIDSEEVLIKKLEEAAPYAVLKIKIGTADDKSLIEIINKHSNKKLSVDVNQGWQNKEEALEMVHWLKSKNVLFVEQPFNKTDFASSAWLTERSPLPIIADESMQRLKDIDTIKNCFHGINIKLMKCGGMLEATQIIKKAQQNNLKILIGCMSETSCAIAAAAHIATAADWIDLDGPLLIKRDFFSGIIFNEGRLCLNDSPGLGVLPV